MATVLAISSHVTRGSVGLAATVPALQWLDHEVWAVPTGLLASRPGPGRLARSAIGEADVVTRGRLSPRRPGSGRRGG